MKLTFKIVLSCIGLTFLIALLVSVTGGQYAFKDFPGWFGLVALCNAGLGLLLALILGITGPKNNEWAKGFLLSAGILLLLGLLTCGSMFSSNIR